MRKLLVILSVGCFSSSLLFAQIQTEAQKEFLGSLSVGDGPRQVRFSIGDEGFFSPGGIFADSRGELFFIQNFYGKPILRFSKQTFSESKAPDNIPETWFVSTFSAFSQNGLTGGGTVYFNLNNQFEQTHFFDGEVMEPSFSVTYIIPSGAIWESTDRKQLFSAEFKVGQTAKLRNREETKAWLPTQPGGFTIGDDGLLYRSGVLWSAFRPTDRTPAGTYIGKLMSGHNVWVGGGMLGFSRFIVISNPHNLTEVILTIPWAPINNGRAPFHPFDYGIGPWGELYYLIAPLWDQSGNYNPPAGSTAELVVVRNHLKFFGRLNADGVRLRKEPSTTADILATYPAKTGFRILGQGGETETINGKTSDWTQVRMLDGKEGWVFGAFVHNLYDGPNGGPPPWPNVPDW